MKFDAIIVGAGPSGCSAAIELARAGSRVLIVEKTIFPRAKACGDGLTARALNAIARMGVDLSSTISIDRVEIVDPDWTEERVFKIPARSRATTYSRAAFDNLLLDAAISAGAALWAPTFAESLITERGVVAGVRLRSKSGRRESVRAPVTIIAEGSVGTLRRQAPIEPAPHLHRCFAVRRYWEQVACGSQTPSFKIVFPVLSDGHPIAGYGWTFPLDCGLTNVGVGYFSSGTTLRINLNQLMEGFERLLKKHDSRFASARPAGALLGAPIQVGGTGASSHGPGVLLVGDSAGGADPFSAEGISHALDSGRMAARACFHHLADGMPLAAYGDDLMRRDPALDRLAPSLGGVYQSIQHLSRDIPAMLDLGSATARATYGLIEKQLTLGDSKRIHSVDISIDTREIQDAVRRRCATLVARARPLFGVFWSNVEGLDDCPRSLTPTALRNIDTASLSVRNRRLAIRVCLCLDLFRVAMFVLDDLHTDRRSSENASRGRGGPWLSARIGLGFADDLLSRVISNCSVLPAPLRIRLSDELFDAAASLSSTSRGHQVPSCRRRDSILQALAQRVRHDLVRQFAGQLSEDRPQTRGQEVGR